MKTPAYKLNDSNGANLLELADDNARWAVSMHEGNEAASSWGDAYSEALDNLMCCFADEVCVEHRDTIVAAFLDALAVHELDLGTALDAATPDDPEPTVLGYWKDLVATGRGRGFGEASS